jgi:hypothetical protein
MDYKVSQLPLNTSFLFSMKAETPSFKSSLRLQRRNLNNQVGFLKQLPASLLWGAFG